MRSRKPFPKNQWQAGAQGRGDGYQRMTEKHVMFFFPRSFLDRRSLRFSDCFTGQSPGMGRNELAISIPVAPALRGSWPSPSQSSLRRGLGGGWARGVGLGPRPGVGSREDHSLQHW